MKTFKEIYEAIRDKFLSLQKKGTNYNIGGFLRSLKEAIAEAIEKLWFHADRIYQALFIPTAKSTYLDKRAKEMGLERRAATKSTGVVTFTGTAGTIYPLGTIVTTDPDGQLVVEFETDAQVTIPGGETTVDADITAKVAGASGNVEAGQINTVKNPPTGHTSVTNQQAVSGGADEETDESLRKRCTLKWYATTYGPTNNTIRSWCLEIDGVAEAQVVGNFPEPGKAKIYIWSRNQAGALVPATSALVTTVQTMLDERRPVCFILTAAVPSGVLVNVEVEITVESGHDFLTVRDAVKSSIQTYFAGLSVGDDVYRAEILYAVMGTTGVENANVIEPTSDEEIGATDTAQLGECTISEMP